MEYQILSSGKNKKILPICHQLNKPRKVQVKIIVKIWLLVSNKEGNSVSDCICNLFIVQMLKAAKL